MTQSRKTHPRAPRLVETRSAGPDHAVTLLECAHSDTPVHQAQVCSQCPWRVRNVGLFPAQAFEHSARSGYDKESARDPNMAKMTFACHASGIDHPRICAGFLLRGAANNLTVRILELREPLRVKAPPEGKLFESYRAMALANGVDPKSPALERLIDSPIPSSAN